MVSPSSHLYLMHTFYTNVPKHLSVQKSYISLFLKHDFDEILVARTVANLSYRNPVKKYHSVANIGLQTIGTMKKKNFSGNGESNS